MVTVYVDEDTYWNLVSCGAPFDAVFMPDEHAHIAISVPVHKVYRSAEEGLVEVMAIN